MMSMRYINCMRNLSENKCFKSRIPGITDQYDFVDATHE